MPWTYCIRIYFLLINALVLSLFSSPLFSAPVLSFAFKNKVVLLIPSDLDYPFLCIISSFFPIYIYIISLCISFYCSPLNYRWRRLKLPSWLLVIFIFSWSITHSDYEYKVDLFYLRSSILSFKLFKKIICAFLIVFRKGYLYLVLTTRTGMHYRIQR